MVRQGREMMNSFVLSASLAIGTPQGVALPDRDAPRYAAKALYKQVGLDKKVSEWEKRHLKLDRYPVIGYIGIVGRIITEQRITYEWKF